MQLTDDEEAMRAALEKERPDPDLFRQATLAKLADAEARPSERPPMAAAAGVLPFEVLGAMVAGRTTGWLTLPFVSLAAAGAMFLWALRKALGMSGAAGQQQDATHVDAVVREWWRGHGWAVALGLASIALTLRFAPLEAVMALLVGSMLAAGSIFGRLAREVAVEPRAVGTTLANFLGLVVLLVLFAGRGDAAWGPSHVHRVWAPTVLLLGSFACECISSWAAWRTTGRRLLGLVAPTITLALVAFVIVPRSTPIDRERLVRWATQFDEPVDDVVAWRRYGEARAALSGLGWNMPEAPSARSIWDRALAVDSAAGENGVGAIPVEARRRVDRFALDGAVHAGVLSPEALSAVALDARGERLLGAAPLAGPPIMARPYLLALLNEGLPEGDRVRIARWVRTGLESQEPYMPMAQALGIVEMLDALGTPVNPDEVAGDLRRLVARTWTPEAASPAATCSSVAAAGLIARFGAPESLSLETMADTLRRLSTPSIVEALVPRRLPMLSIQRHRYDSAAALHVLRATPDFQAIENSRQPAPWIVAERLLITAVLLALLCVIGTLRSRAIAPAQLREGRSGTAP